MLAESVGRYLVNPISVSSLLVDMGCVLVCPSLLGIDRRFLKIKIATMQLLKFNSRGELSPTRMAVN